MTQPGKNVRLRRTQKLLREALIALIEERGFDALTIGELTERAMGILLVSNREKDDNDDRYCSHRRLHPDLCCPV